LRSFDKGILLKDRTSDFIEFHKWDEVLNIERLVPPKSSTFMCYLFEWCPPKKNCRRFLKNTISMNITDVGLSSLVFLAQSARDPMSHGPMERRTCQRSKIPVPNLCSEIVCDFGHHFHGRLVDLEPIVRADSLKFEVFQ
jgi:hypothetical protein